MIFMLLLTEFSACRRQQPRERQGALPILELMDLVEDMSEWRRYDSHLACVEVEKTSEV
jgi:hypothetical protein